MFGKLLKIFDKRDTLIKAYRYRDTDSYSCLLLYAKGHVIAATSVYVTLSHLRSKESTGIHKPCIPALLSYQRYI